MTGLLAALRGLLHRAGISLNILLVAVVAVAAVTIGPAYYAAAQSSVVQDTVGTASAAGRGLEVNQSGPVDAVNSVAVEVQGLLARYLGGQAIGKRLFGPPVMAAETTVQADHQTVPLVYRSGVCAHLRFTSGHCPRTARQVAVSTSLAFLLHWHTGQRIAVSTWGHLVITGQYRSTWRVRAAGTGSTRAAATSPTRRPMVRTQPRARTTRCSPRRPRWMLLPAISRAPTTSTSR